MEKINPARDLGIYIPSRGRADRQLTLQKIPDEYRDITYLVVPEDEEDTYRHLNKGVSVMACSRKGIGRTRQWILETCKKKYVLMIDDDLYFYHRKAQYSVELVNNTKKDNKAMLDEVFASMIDDGFIHVGVAARPEASFFLCDSRIVMRANNFHGFNVRQVLKHAARFDALPVMEDFNVTLSLFEKGFPNRVLVDYVWNQPGSNTTGGCSTYRTAKLQAKAAHALAALHPPKIVRIRQRKVIGKTSWEGMKERTDVFINWHNAWKAGGFADHPNWKHETFLRRREYTAMVENANRSGHKGLRIPPAHITPTAQRANKGGRSSSHTGGKK
jgi:hypothetical protein